MCSLCRKNHRDVNHLIAGPGANICDECVHACVALIDREEEL
jgi:ATP-dependent Clp protease ATP-binding subunit ClpX